MLFPVRLLLIIHLETGSLVPPCTHMAGPRSPVLLRHLDKVVGFLVPRTKVSFLVLDSRSSFRILVPRSRSNLQIYHTLPSFGERGLTHPGYNLHNNSLNVGPGNAGPKIITMRRGPSMVCLVRASFLSCVPFRFGNP